MKEPACGWCDGAIRPGARRDSIYCSQRCRQAAHRFHGPSRRAGAALHVVPGPGRRFAYADPPYPGQARRYYADHPDYAGEIDHQELLNRLTCSYDGWALSTSALALRDILPSCPPGSRVAAWFRGERPTRSYLPLSAWEPVIYYGSRRDVSARDWHDTSRVDVRRLDALICHGRPRLTDTRRVIGAKPAPFCAWLFSLLGLGPDDELDDLYPGSGGVALAWQTYRSAARDASRPTADATA